MDDVLEIDVRTKSGHVFRVVTDRGGVVIRITGKSGSAEIVYDGYDGVRRHVSREAAGQLARCVHDAVDAYNRRLS